MPFPTWLSRSEEADLLLQEAVGGGGNVLPETADQATWLKPPGGRGPDGYAENRI